jgi:amino acid adenylation domain-containing protein
MTNVHIQRILSNLNETNHKIAIVDGFKSVTYAELNDEIQRICNAIQYSKSNRVGVFLSSSFDAYASIISCWLMGKSYVILPPEYPSERIELIVKLSNLSCVITTSALRRKIELDEGISIIELQNIEIPQYNIVYNLPDPLDEAYLLFTSGTTGHPKGVPITHKNLSSFVSAFGDIGYNLNSEDRFLQMFELTFDLSIMSFLIPLTIGASFYLTDKTKIKPLAIYEILEIHRISFALLVPSVVRLLEPYIKDETITTLKYTQFCGEALTISHVKSWQKICPNSEIDNVYGPTEATIYCANYRIPKNDQIDSVNGIVSIGKPMSSTALVIQGNELLIGGLQITSGYINNNELKSFVQVGSDRFYRSGDIGSFNNGLFYCLGRLDRQIKIQGFRVELSEIEHIFNMAFPNSESVVIFLKEPAEILILCFLDQENHIAIESISQILKMQLPGYMIPNKFVKFKKWPLNSNGKIDRNVIKDEIFNSQS